MEKRKKIYLIDGNSFIYRMFFALPEFSTSSGKVVNAVFWMAKFFLWQLCSEKPEYIVFIKDAKGENFRHKLYADYKATRDKMPDNLRLQIRDIEELIESMGIEIIEKTWYEADDVIATLAQKLSQDASHDIYILSWDKDLFALISKNIFIYDTQKKKIYGEEECKEKFGVPSVCIRDYLAICGDTSDNIPGIAGIGPKKAQCILNEVQNLDELYDIIDTLWEKSLENYSPEFQKLLTKKLQEKFILWRENAFLSQKLASLCYDVDMKNFQLESFSFSPEKLYTETLILLLEKHEFHSLLKNKSQTFDSWDTLQKKVVLIENDKNLQELHTKIFSHKREVLVIDTETTSLDVQQAQLVWVSILLKEDEIFYISFLHKDSQIPRCALKRFLSDIYKSDICLIAHNFKYDHQIIQKFLEGDDIKSSPFLGLKQVSLF